MTFIQSVYFRLTLAAVAIAAAVGVSYAVPADPRPKKFTQPDGTVVTVQLRGDERCHFYLSEDDYLLVEKDGALYYGTTDASGEIAASDILVSPMMARTSAENDFLSKVEMPKVYEALERKASRSNALRVQANGPGLFEGSNFPVTGKQKVLVILVEYKDVKFTLDDPYGYFHRMLNEEGFSDYNATGSARDYFLYNSCGQFEPEFDVYGPLELSKVRKFYGGNDLYGDDQNAYMMAVEACQLLDETVDFSEFDRNGDGFVDNVFIFYAGEGEATGGGPDTVWPHSWEISHATNKEYVLDGVKLDRYGCSNEWEDNRPDGVGTFIHEFSHVMGLPDLYATSYTSAFTPGYWSALDYGPYNNDGCTPPNYGAFERYALGWLDPEPITGGEDVTLRPVGENVARIILSGDPDEYFLLENRQQTGWDTYIPGHGMLVWHIDYDPVAWANNTVNNSSRHQRVDIEEADGRQNSYSRDGDSFPGTQGVTSFTDDTDPSMRLWSGVGLNLPITEIAEDGDGIITFKVAGGKREVTPVTVIGPTGLTDVSFSIAWSEDPKAERYLVSIYTIGDDGPSYVNGWHLRDMGAVTETTVEGLKPLTTYCCEVYSAAGSHMSDVSNVLEITTSEPSFSSLAPVTLEASGIGSASFTARWTPLDEATGYMLSVVTKGEWISETDGTAFTGGLEKLPEEWVSSSKLTFGSLDYSGKAAPSVRLSSGDNIMTPVYDYDINSLTFWHRGSGSSQPESRIHVLAVKDGVYEEIAVLNVCCEKGGETCVIDIIPEATRQLCLRYDAAAKNDALAVDDIELTYGTRREVATVGDYDALPVGNVTSWEVVGLKSNTDYYYSVIASDGSRTSLVSNETKVTTTDTDALTDIVADGAVLITGRSIAISSKPEADVEVYDIAGRLVCGSRTDASGHAGMEIPSPGIYLLRIAGRQVKIFVN